MVHIFPSNSSKDLYIYIYFPLLTLHFSFQKTSQELNEEETLKDSISIVPIEKEGWDYGLMLNSVETQ